MLIKHALIVDDSKSARLVLQRLLARIQVSVDTVDSAEAALTFLEHQKPDVIFMDHMMPGMDGLEATQIIRDNPKTSSIPTIMYTSKDGEDYFKIALESGAKGVLAKPANQEAVMAVIDSLDAPAANDEVQKKPFSDIPLIEVDHLVQKHLKAALAEAKGEITAGIDTTATQLQQHQKHQLDIIRRQLQQQVDEVRKEFNDDLTPQALFRKTQQANQRLTLAVVNKATRRATDELTTTMHIQRVSLESRMKDQQLQMEILIRTTAIRAAFAGAGIGVLAALMVTILV